MKVNILCLLFLGLLPFATNAQDDRYALLPVISYDKPAEFEIGGIRVSGAQYADANTLIAIAGFRVGDKIRVPGSIFAKAVQSLWNLKLFTDVQINQERTVGDKIFLEIVVQELPRYTRHSFIGIKKSKHDDLNGVINKFLQKGSILTENVKATLIYKLEEYYVEKGFLDAKVSINDFSDERATNSVRLEFVIEKAKKVKIRSISFTGNNSVKAKTLRKKMKETHEKKKIFKK